MSTGWPNRWTGMIARVRSRDQLLDQVEVEVPGLVLGVDRHRHAAVVERGERGGDVGAGADQDLVAGLELERRDREVQRGRAARTATPWRAPDVVGELALEAGDLDSPNEPEISPRRTAAATASTSSSPM